MLPLNVHIFGAAKKNTSNSLTKILTLQKKKKKKKKKIKKKTINFGGRLFNFFFF
jgi:hypothetical protein